MTRSGRNNRRNNSRNSGRSGSRGSWRGSWDHGPRYGLLLVVLIATYLASAFLATSWVSGLQIALFVVVTGLALRNGLVARRIRQLGVAAATAGSAVAVVLVLTTAPDPAVGVANLWGGLLLLLSVVLILRRVLAQPRVTIQSIFGAVSTYLVIGLMYAEFYAAVSRFSQGHFFVHGAASVKTYQYFSFTTLTTLGYGDFTAAGSVGRAVAVIEAMTGQIFLATLVARLVSAFRPSRPPEPPDGGKSRKRATGQ